MKRKNKKRGWIVTEDAGAFPVDFVTEVRRVKCLDPVPSFGVDIHLAPSSLDSTDPVLGSRTRHPFLRGIPQDHADRIVFNLCEFLTNPSDFPVSVRTARELKLEAEHYYNATRKEVEE